MPETFNEEELQYVAVAGIIGFFIFLILMLKGGQIFGSLGSAIGSFINSVLRAANGLM